MPKYVAVHSLLCMSMTTKLGKEVRILFDHVPLLSPTLVTFKVVLVVSADERNNIVAATKLSGCISNKPLDELQFGRLKKFSILASQYSYLLRAHKHIQRRDARSDDIWGRHWA